MYGSRPPRRTLLTVALALLALALLPASSAVAQSAGDRQYSDPLVTDGGGQQPEPAPDTPTSSDGSGQGAAPSPATGSGDASGAVDLPAGAEPAQEFADDPSSSAGTLPRTGADAALLAGLGLAALALGALGLAVARDPRHARR
ncbi:MAG: hypothetical protein GXY03_12550 [Solirubrobacterales bacterium]|nr:hypothetical protein [Solirubrobacterales bacterium]